MATGVLVLAIGQATKLVPYLTAQRKAYEATVSLGVETDTLDAEGREVRRVPVSDAIRAALARSRKLEVAPEIAAALAAELARTSQVPPAYSAIKQDGERSYAKARRGEETTLARAIEVHDLRLLDAGEIAETGETGADVDAPFVLLPAGATQRQPAPWMALSLEVSKGFYVRSLARDLAEALGTVGHLTALRRTRSGPFLIEEALPIDTPPDELEARILPLPHAARRALPAAFLSPEGATDARYGRLVAAADIEASSRMPHAWFDVEGKLVAIGEIREDGFGHILRGFN